MTAERSNRYIHDLFTDPSVEKVFSFAACRRVQGIQFTLVWPIQQKMYNEQVFTEDKEKAVI